MPNIAVLLKHEIKRLARKEAKALVLPLTREKVLLKRRIRDLRRQVSAFEQQLRALAADWSRRKATAPQAAGSETRMRITAKGMRSLRRKLGLTQAEFAALLGVTGQAVYQWEHREGALRVRGRVREALAQVRGMGARDARRALESRPAARRPAKRKK